MLRYLYILAFATSLFSQMSDPWEFTDAAFLRRIIVQYYGIERQAVIYLHQGGLNEAEVDPATGIVRLTGPEEKNVDLRGFVMRNLGGHFTLQNVRDRKISSEQYEIACNVFGLEPRPNRAMLVLYFDGSAVQVPFDEERTQLLPELRKLGWEPFKERLKGFLERNPYSVEPLGPMMQAASDLMRPLVRKVRQDQDRAAFGEAVVGAQTESDESFDEAIKSYINALKTINGAESLEWSSSNSVSTTFIQNDLRGVALVTENPEFQQELAKILELYEDEILRYPYSAGFYSDWLGFLQLSKNPEPMKLLDKLALPPSNKKWPNFANRAFSPLLLTPDRERMQLKEYQDLANYLFKLADDITNWMEELDPDFVDGMFSESYPRFVGEKAGFLLRYERFPELQAYLNGLRNKSGENWPELVKEIKGWYWANFWNRASSIMDEFDKNQIERILDAPAAPQTERRPTTYGIHIFHNLGNLPLGKLQAALPRDRGLLAQDKSMGQGSWTLYNSKALISSGQIALVEGGRDNENNDPEMQELYELIKNEEYKNLDALERFIRFNPDCYEAMDMYCQQAEKFLPNGNIERNMLNYASITRTPISQAAYSKMEGKENWSRLASRMLREGLQRLGDVPLSPGRDLRSPRNPWLRLHLWEEMDAGKNAIDWYGFLENTELWYGNAHYVNRYTMPEPVFVKYLHQAERANDWEAVLSACRARFYWNKEQCKDDRFCEDKSIPAAWERAEEKLKGRADLGL